VIAVLFVRGPAWDEDAPLAEQAGLAGHVEWVHANRDRPGGAIVEAGPFHSPDSRVEGQHVGLALLDLATLEEARELVELDPVVASGAYGYLLFEWGGDRLRQ
jgi:uncharacterized protein YciI